MAFPLLPLALALVAGITLAQLVALPFSIAVLLLFLSLSLAWIFFSLRRHEKAFLAVLTAFLFFGSSYFLLQHRAYESNPLRAIETADYLDLEGRVEKTPDLTKDRFQLLIKTRKVRFKGQEQLIRGRVQVSFPYSNEGRPPELLAGDEVRISARLLHDDDFSNFSPSVSLRTMKARQIHRRAYSKSFLLLEKIDQARFSWSRPISWLHRQLQKKIERHLAMPDNSLTSEGAFLEALLLGERGRLDESIIRSLQSSGLFHLIAISGAHIAIISYFLFQMFRLLRLSPEFRSILIIIILIFYALLVEGRPSVVRATTMTIIYLLGRLLWKDTNLLNTLAAAALFLLLLNPLQLFEAGFILTFMATLTIIIFFPKLKRFLPILPLRLTDLFILSVTAQLGVLPFIAYSFNRVTLGSLVLNLAAVPLVGFIMALGWLFFVVSFLSSGVGALIAFILKQLIHLFFLISNLFTGFKPFSYRLPTPFPWIIIGYFLFLFLLIIRRRFRFQKLVFTSGLAIFTFFLICFPFPSTTKNLRLTLLDVGQGEATLIEFPGREKMLIDGGGFHDDSFDVGEYVVSPFLWRRGIKKIDYLVLTHGHPDHLYGLRAVARNFKIGEFWEAVKPLETKAYDELLASFSRKTKRSQYFRSEQKEIAGFRIEFLHPPAERVSPAPVSNEDCLVFRLNSTSGLVILTGDIGQKSEEEMLNAGLDLQALVFKSPHHGSRTSNSPAFLSMVNPKVVLISAGRDNIYGVPHPEIIERYENLGALIFRTDKDGAIELTFKKKELLIRTSRSLLDIKLSLD